SLDSGFRLRPQGDLVALAVGKAPRGKDYEIDKGPYTQAAKGKQLGNAGAGFSDIKPVNAKAAQKETKKKCRQDALIGSRILSFLWRSAVWASNCGFMYL